VLEPGGGRKTPPIYTTSIGIFPGRGRGIGDMASAEREPITGVLLLGDASGIQRHSLWSGGEALAEAESFEAIARLKKAQKLLSICQERLNMALAVSK